MFNSFFSVEELNLTYGEIRIVFQRTCTTKTLFLFPKNKYFLQSVDWFQIKTEMGQEVPARTGLGSTTVLAVVTIGFGFVGTTKAGGIIEGQRPIAATNVLIRMVRDARFCFPPFFSRTNLPEKLTTMNIFARPC
jgi:hypothetical protein